MDPRKTLITDVSSADILLAVMEPGEGGRDHHGDEIRLNKLTWTCESKTSPHNEKGIARLLTNKEKLKKNTTVQQRTAIAASPQLPTGQESTLVHAHSLVLSRWSP